MVASKTKKTAKVTYAERVLGALSHAQQEHRKQAVHHATLRAEVRKRAELKKDKLGPQWTSWVKRTVEKLEDKGAIEESGPNGSVTLTHAAKKAINDARRELSSSGIHVEDDVWRLVSQQFTRGTKRDLESEADSPKGKRRRRSSGRGRSPSKMTKAELLQNLRNLQEAHGQAMADLENHAHEEESDEFRRLRDELEAKEKEIEAVRKELEQVKSTALSTSTAAGNVLSISRATTPDGTSSREEPVSSTPANIPRALDSLVRTQSGSFISQFSKRPTPAPSSPGTPEMQPVCDDASMTFDDEGDTLIPAEDQETGVAGMSKENALLTPEWSPRKSQQQDLAARLEKLQRLYDVESETAQRRAAQYQDKLASLEQISDLRASKLSEVTDRLTAMEAERTAMQVTITERDQRVADLVAELTAEKDLVAARDTSLVSKDSETTSETTSLQERLASIEQTSAVLRIRQEELEGTLSERDATITSLTMEKTTLLSELEGVQGALADSVDQLRTKDTELQALRDIEIALTKEKSMLQDKAADLERETSKSFALSTKLASQEAENVALQFRLQSSEDAVIVLRAESRAMHAEKVKLEEAHQIICQVVEQKNKEIAAYMSECGSLKTQTASLDSGVGDLKGQLAASRDVLDGLRVELSDAKALVWSLQENVAAKNTTITDLESSQEKLSQDIVSLRCELSRNKIRVSQLELNEDELRERLGNSKERVLTVARDLEVAHKAREDLIKNIQQLEAASAERMQQLAAKNSEIERLSGKLVALQARESDLVAKMVELEAAREDEQANHEFALLSLESSMEASLCTMRKKLFESQTRQDALESQVKGVQEELTSTKMSLQAECARSSAMEQDLNSATGRIHQLQDALDDATATRRAEEIKVATVLEGYHKLRKLQVDSLTDFDQTIASIQASRAGPTPVRH